MIVSIDAANEIADLATDYYIWAVDTVANRAALSMLESEVTTFPFDEGDMAVQMFECYVEAIIEHHPCWKELLVVGGQ
nr:hypothetical protein [Methylomarinum sp. Ch1-1]MDP4520765.1 hypothetical protein [Methylomarinum sp. Ch1-1]